MGMVKVKARGLGICPQLGFTLLEVLVAVLILSLAYVAVLQNFSQSSSNIFRLEKGMITDLHDAMALEQQLREVNPGGEVLVLGQKFVLKKIEANHGQLETVKVVKR
jgi:prepilin-type N-terminal cleavage/methylation domain-containing protein